MSLKFDQSDIVLKYSPTIPSSQGLLCTYVTVIFVVLIYVYAAFTVSNIHNEININVAEYEKINNKEVALPLSEEGYDAPVYAEAAASLRARSQNKLFKITH